VMQCFDSHAVVESEFAQTPCLARGEAVPVDRRYARLPVERKLVEAHGECLKNVRATY